MAGRGSARSQRSSSLRPDNCSAVGSSRSKGRIKVTIHPGGALAAAPAHYENVVAGAFDIGWTLQGYTPGRFPLSSFDVTSHGVFTKQVNQTVKRLGEKR